MNEHALEFNASAGRQMSEQALECNVSGRRLKSEHPLEFKTSGGRQKSEQNSRAIFGHLKCSSIHSSLSTTQEARETT